MKWLAYRPREDGSYDSVGMNNILPISDLLTIRGVKNRLVRTGWAKHGQRVKLEQYGSSFQGKPFKTFHVILDY